VCVGASLSLYAERRWIDIHDKMVKKDNKGEEKMISI